MVPGWFRAFRLVLVSNDKTAHRASPTASEDSGMVPRWFRVFRLQLASTDETTHRVSPTTSYGFGMVPRWFRAFRLGLISSNTTAHRASPTAYGEERRGEESAARGGRRLARAGASWKHARGFFLPKLIPSLIRLGSNLVKIVTTFWVAAGLAWQVVGWVVGWLPGQVGRWPRWVSG